MKNNHAVTLLNIFTFTQNLTMVSTVLIWHLINLLSFIHLSSSQTAVYCIYGYTGSNTYLSGKNTYYRRFDNLPELYYRSNTVPLQADLDRHVYIWQNTTDDCWVFLTLPTSDDRGSYTSWPIDGYVTKYKSMYSICARISSQI